MKLLPGDLILVRGEDLVSRAIEKITHSEYSHVAGFVKDNELIEAQGFRTAGWQALDTYKGVADVYRCDRLTSAMRPSLIRAAMAQKGLRYAYLLVCVWEPIHFLLGIDLPWIAKRRRDCATLWQTAYKSIGIDLCPGIPFAAPSDLAASKLLRRVGSI